MMMKLTSGLRIAMAATLLTLNSILHVTPLLVVALVKAIVRIRPVRNVCDRGLMALAASWIDVNSWMFDHLTDTKIVVTGLPEPMPEGHFLVIWQPPVLGRHSGPAKIVQSATSDAALFSEEPVDLGADPGSGLVGTGLSIHETLHPPADRKAPRTGRPRYCRHAKSVREIPPDTCLDRQFWSKARVSSQTSTRSSARPFGICSSRGPGATAFVLDAMGESLDTLVDVTITYPDGAGELGDLFANRIKRIHVEIQLLPIPPELRGGDYQNDEAHRQRIQSWINERWVTKDKTVERLLSSAPDPSKHA